MMLKYDGYKANSLISAHLIVTQLRCLTHPLLLACLCVVMWGEPLPSAGHQLIAAIRRCSLSVYPDFWFWEWYRRWCAIVRVPQFSHRYLLLCFVCISLAHLQSTIIRIRCNFCALPEASVSLTITPHAMYGRCCSFYLI